MNCRDVEREIFGGNPTPLPHAQTAELSRHLEECASCRATRDSLAAAWASLRQSTVSATVPDAVLEWQKLRREIRGGSNRSEIGAHRRGPLWFALPLTAAAAVLVAFFVSPRSTLESSPDRSVVSATGAATGAKRGATVVFVDEKSGWTFVVAADEASRG